MSFVKTPDIELATNELLAAARAIDAAARGFMAAEQCLERAYTRHTDASYALRKLVVEARNETDKEPDEATPMPLPRPWGSGHVRVD